MLSPIFLHHPFFYPCSVPTSHTSSTLQFMITRKLKEGPERNLTEREGRRWVLKGLAKKHNNAVAPSVELMQLERKRQPLQQNFPCQKKVSQLIQALARVCKYVLGTAYFLTH